MLPPKATGPLGALLRPLPGLQYCLVGIIGGIQSGPDREHKPPKPAHFILLDTFYKKEHRCVHCILEEVVSVEVSSGGVIPVGQETAAWSLWVWDTGGAKRGMEVWGRGLSDSASVPAEAAKRVDLPTTMAMLVITAANADTVLT